jgi:hypothetical protein
MSMKIELELTDEEEARLRRGAAACGQPIDDYLRSLIPAYPEQPRPGPAPTAGVELLARLRADGALGIWKDKPDTPEFARELRRRAEKRAGIS